MDAHMHMKTHTHTHTHTHACHLNVGIAFGLNIWVAQRPALGTHACEQSCCGINTRHCPIMLFHRYPCGKHLWPRQAQGPTSSVIRGSRSRVEPCFAENSSLPRMLKNSLCSPPQSMPCSPSNLICHSCNRTNARQLAPTNECTSVSAYQRMHVS
jgi:hypothetical protein